MNTSILCERYKWFSLLISFYVAHWIQGNLWWGRKEEKIEGESILKLMWGGQRILCSSTSRSNLCSLCFNKDPSSGMQWYLTCYSSCWYDDMLSSTKELKRYHPPQALFEKMRTIIKHAFTYKGNLQGYVGLATTYKSTQRYPWLLWWVKEQHSFGCSLDWQ
jgi:hypothetical protein